jgi:biotin carboxylase
MISPGFPAEMPHFTSGLARVGAKVIGMGDQPESALPLLARENLAAYVQIQSFVDEQGVLEQVRELSAKVKVHRVECLWEPYMILAARMREMLGLPGMTVEQTLPFRDKEAMKRVLDRAGIRTPKHDSASSVRAVRRAAQRIGYPLVVKPIAGAGSSHTYRVDSSDELEQILPALRGVPEVSVEEFVEGEDFTFDTICVDGEIRFYSIAFYRPRALIQKTNEWISPQTVVVREVDAPELEPGREMGRAVVRALGFQTGYTHMEWYRTSSGEAVFGEIAARPPGARLVDLINYASDIDTYTGWAEATCRGRFTQQANRKFNAAWVFKRAQGEGRIQRIEGLAPLLQEYGPSICELNLLPVGAPRRDWRQTLLGDGLVILRHPDLETLLYIADRFGTELQLYAE